MSGDQPKKLKHASMKATPLAALAGGPITTLPLRKSPGHGPSPSSADHTSSSSVSNPSSVGGGSSKSAMGSATVVASKPRKRRTEYVLVSAADQPFVFDISLNSSQSTMRVQAKDTLTKDAFKVEVNASDLRSLGFFQSLNGFYKRLKLAITNSEEEDDLRAYYRLLGGRKSTLTGGRTVGSTPIDSKSEVLGSRHASDSTTSDGYRMELVLEEQSKYDDESNKYRLILPQLDIKDTVKLGEKLDDVVTVVSTTEQQLNERLDFVVKQVKSKFDREKQHRLELEKKMDTYERAFKKLHKMVKELESRVAGGPITDQPSEAGSEHGKTDGVSSAEGQSSNPTTDAAFSEEIATKFAELQMRVLDSEQNMARQVKQVTFRLDEMSPKLARLQSRRTFRSEESYIDYLLDKLENWDRKKDGPILVKVHPKAEGKAKRFIGYTGEPVKWSKSNCQVKWFRTSSTTPETIKWHSLSVFLPLSAFYTPECPQTLEAPKDASAMQL